MSSVRAPLPGGRAGDRADGVPVAALTPDPAPAGSPAEAAAVLSRLARTADRCAQVELIIAQTLEDLANRGGARVQIRRRLAAEAREHAEELHQWAVQLRATERLG